MKKKRLHLVVVFLCLALLAGLLLRQMFLKENLGTVGARSTKVGWLVEPQFYDATRFVEGLAWVQERANGPWRMIDMQQNILVENIQAFRVSAFQADAGVFTFIDEQWLHGILNRSGEVRVSPKYAQIDSFEGATAPAAIKDKANRFLFGAMDSHGEIVLPFRYDQPVTVLSSDMFSVSDAGKWGAVNKQAQVRIPFEYGAAIRLLRGSGYFVAPLILEEPQFTEDKGVVRLKPGQRKVRVIDARGRSVLPDTYESVSFGEGIFSVEKDGRLVFLNKKGAPVFKGDFYAQTVGITNESSFSEGLAAVHLESSMLKGRDARAPQRSAVINKKGITLFEFEGTALSPFKRGFLLVLEQHGDEERLVLYDSKGTRAPLPRGLLLMGNGANSFDGQTLIVKKRESGKVGFLKITP